MTDPVQCGICKNKDSSFAAPENKGDLQKARLNPSKAFEKYVVWLAEQNNLHYCMLIDWGKKKYDVDKQLMVEKFDLV